MSTIEPDATVPRRYTQAGDYDLIRKMGSGGFGVVFEARHRRTGLMYALKRVELSAEDAKRFENEALYPAKIASRSLHVLGVQNFFHDPSEDVFYLVTELVPHGDLRTFLDNNPKPLPIALALEVAIGIAKGLTAIHTQGIIHRDLKPANVLMDQKDDQWVPKIADFGLARSTNSISIGEFASSGYAAPEQIDLLSDQPLGPESDLFSFGMILYELLTGQKPTTARDIREYGRWIGTKQMAAPPSAVRAELATWPQLDTLVASLLQFDRTKRANAAPDVVKTLTQVLRRVESGEQPQTDKAAPPPTPTPTPESTSTAAPPESHTAPPEVTTGAWTRRRTLTYMAGVFVVTGLAMPLGMPWMDRSSKFALPALPLMIGFGGLQLAPWYAQAAWFVIPALFGLALGLAVRLSLSRAAMFSALCGVAYQLAVWATVLGMYAIAALSRASGGTSSGADYLFVLILFACALGALLVCTALAPWHRPSGRDLGLTTLSGLLGAGGYFLLVALGWAGLKDLPLNQSLVTGFVFACWQVVVGLLIVDRTLFKATTTIRHWSLKPIVHVVTATILLAGVATWARTRPVPLEPGKSEDNPKNKASYVWIPPGEFQMGCSADDSECRQDEQPTRTVTFTKGFWFGQREVTTGQWKEAPGTRPVLPPGALGGTTFETDWSRTDSPIVNMTWQEARDYCSAVDGRLPTEAEWEYAARAGTSGARYGRLDEVAYYADNSGQGALSTAALSDSALEQTLVSNRNWLQSVFSKGSNKWSVNGMLGNVAEWVEDDYADTTVLGGVGCTDRPTASPDRRRPSAEGGSRRIVGQPRPRYSRVGPRRAACRCPVGLRRLPLRVEQARESEVKRIAVGLGVLVLAVAAWAVVSAVGSDEVSAVTPPAIERLRNGDLIFRSGVSVDSQLIKMFDPGSKYSHVGMIDVRDGNAYVVHIEPDERGDSKVRRDPLADFLAPRKADGFAVYHVLPDDDQRARAAIQAALGYQARGVLFDRDFSLDTEDKMYCTELVWRAYLDAGLDLLGGDFGPMAKQGRLIRLTTLAQSKPVVLSETGGAR